MMSPLGLLALVCLASSSPTRYVMEETDQKVGYFWHLTDLHYDNRYKEGNQGSNIKEYQNSNKKDYFIGNYDPGCWTEGRGHFGDYNCDAPLALISSATQFIKNFPKPADGDVNFILWTGDDTSHANDTYFNKNLVMDAIDVISSKIADIGLDVYPVLGNHDIHPKNQFPVEGQSSEWDSFYDDVAIIWQRRLQTPGDILDQFTYYGGFYTVPPSKAMPWRLVGLHSTLWYKSNHVTDEMPDPANQFRWMEEIFDASRANNESVLIFSHIPPGKFERFYQFCGEYKHCGNYSGYHWFTEDFNNKYLDIIEKYSDIIAGQFYGHHHTDSFKSFLSLDGSTPLSWGFIAPGVTPWITTLAPESGGNNPGVRLFKYDTNNGKILDYTQYWLNLTEANASGRTTWQKEYSFLEYFGLHEISAQSVSNLITKIHEDTPTFNKYYSVNTVKFEEATLENCDSNCRKFHFCAMNQLRYDRFETCVN